MPGHTTHAYRHEYKALHFLIKALAFTYTRTVSPPTPPKPPTLTHHTTPQAPHTHWFSYGISWVALDR